MKTVILIKTPNHVRLMMELCGHLYNNVMPTAILLSTANDIGMGPFLPCTLTFIDRKHGIQMILTCDVFLNVAVKCSV